MAKRITEEQKQRIYDLYDAGMTVYLHIAKEVGISDATIGKIIKARNASCVKVCPNCKRESGREERFCFYCGKNIRTREEELASEVSKLRGMIVHLPENVRAEFDGITREIMGYLKEKGA